MPLTIKLRPIETTVIWHRGDALKIDYAEGSRFRLIRFHIYGPESFDFDRRTVDGAHVLFRRERLIVDHAGESMTISMADSSCQTNPRLYFDAPWSWQVTRVAKTENGLSRTGRQAC